MGDAGGRCLLLTWGEGARARMGGGEHAWEAHAWVAHGRRMHGELVPQCKCRAGDAGEREVIPLTRGEGGMRGTGGREARPITLGNEGRRPHGVSGGMGGDWMEVLVLVPGSHSALSYSRRLTPAGSVKADFVQVPLEGARRPMAAGGARRGHEEDAA